jgi:hypothetical protein
MAARAGTTPASSAAAQQQQYAARLVGELVDPGLGEDEAAPRLAALKGMLKADAAAPGAPLAALVHAAVMERMAADDAQARALLLRLLGEAPPPLPPPPRHCRRPPPAARRLPLTERAPGGLPSNEIGATLPLDHSLPQGRRLALDLCDHLFARSRAYRGLVTASLGELLALAGAQRQGGGGAAAAAAPRRPLPGPAAAAAALREEALAALSRWAAAHGRAHPQLALAARYLSAPSSDAGAAAAATAREREQEELRVRFEDVSSSFNGRAGGLESLLDQLAAAAELLEQAGGPLRPREAAAMAQEQEQQRQQRPEPPQLQPQQEGRLAPAGGAEGEEEWEEVAGVGGGGGAGNTRCGGRGAQADAPFDPSLLDDDGYGGDGLAGYVPQEEAA